MNLDMKWFYDLPKDRQIELENTVYAEVFDRVLAALGGARTRENEEVAVAAACFAMYREQFPF